MLHGSTIAETRGPAADVVAALTIDRYGRVHASDGGFAELYGGASDLAGCPLTAIVDGLILADTGGGSANATLRRMDGSTLPIRATFSAIVDDRRTLLIEPLANAASRHAAFLLGLSDRLRGITDPIAILAATGEALGRHLRVSRVGYGEVDPTEQWLIIERDWTDGVPSLVGRHPLPLGSSISDAYRRGETVASEDLRTMEGADAHERELLIGMGIAGSVAVPLIKDGRLAAFMAAQHHLPRPWSAEEILLVEEVAERTWATLEHARTSTRLRDSEEQFRTLAENIPSICWLGDADGRPTYFNRRGIAFFDEAGVRQGNIPGLCHPDELDIIGKRWTSAIHSGDPYEMTVALRGREGNYRPFLSRAEPVRDGSGRVVRWCGIVTDLTEKRAAERRAAFVAALSERLRHERSAEVILSVTVEMLGIELAASRVVYSDHDALDGVFDTRHEWGDGSLPSLCGRLPVAVVADALLVACRRGDAMVAHDDGGYATIGDATPASGAAIAMPLMKNGELVGVLGVHQAGLRAWAADEIALVEDIAERTWATISRAHAEAELRARARDQRFLLAWSDTVRRASDAAAILAHTTEALGHHLHLSRVFFAEADDAGEWMTVQADWVDGLLSYAGARFSVSSHGMAVVDDHHAGRPFVTNDVSSDARLDANNRAICADVGVRAFVRVPLIRQGRVTAVLSMQQATPRRWADNEVALITDLAERTWAVLQRAQSEDQLRESEALLAAFMENAPIGMCLKDADGRYVRLNPEMARALRVPMDEAIGHTTSELLGSENRDDVSELDRRALAGVVQRQEIQVSNRDEYGSALFIRFPVAGPGGARRTGGFTIDISERKRTEAALERSREALFQSEKLTALGSLLAGVSHELNNPLSIIVGHAVMLERQAEGTPQAERADKIRKAAYRCARIVQTFLAMARQKTPERASVELNEIVAAALELTEYGLRANGIAVLRDLAPHLPALDADADQLHQVIVNLIINAQQAMQDEPTPRELRITTRAAPGKRAVCVEVADTGPGVPIEARRRIFEPFFTTKPQGVGTGVGLSFSQGLVEAHGGTLELLDTDRGACFRLVLPTGSHVPAPAVTTKRQTGLAVRGRTALIVDDEREIAETLADFLSMEGYVCQVAIGGIDARECLSRDDYDLVVSDLRMPDLDGPALFAWLQAERPAMAGRVAFVTGDTLGRKAALFLARAGRPVVEKPFTPESVRRLIDEMERA